MARNANDLLADLDQLGVEEKSGSQPKSSKTTPKPAKDSSNKPSSNDDDPFGDLQAQLAAKAQPTSRPATPRMSSSATSANNKSPKRAEHTPASSGPPSGRTSSEDKIRSNTSAGPVRKSGESARGYHQGVTPNDNSEEKPAQPENSKAQTSPGPASGGGWWGSMYSAATAAVKQAETLAKEISGNEEAQRWAGQVRAIGGKNLTNLQHLSTDLRSRALPTFTTLLQHIAPPISAHERLQIHTTHDILNYPGLDPLIYQVFSRTMSQVEGGDLMVIQRGTEQRSRASASADDPQGYRGGVLGSSSGGWSDGPWWREGGVTRSLGTVPGLKEGSRLARVGAEAYAREFFDAKGGVEEAAKAATQTLSETNPVRSSDIFLAIQAISYEDDEALFADDGRKSEGAAGGREGGVAEPAPEKAESVVFAVYLHDPIHSLSFSTLSQPFPAKWASWLDASAGESESGLPDSIQEIIAAGGLDPREWVAEWMEETLSLAVGVVAQRYVARRMGVGEGGLGRGKKRVEEEGMGGEAARAI